MAKNKSGDFNMDFEADAKKIDAGGICKFCGSIYKKGAKFCDECEAVICPQCSETNPKGAIICGNCDFQFSTKSLRSLKKQLKLTEAAVAYVALAVGIAANLIVFVILFV
ncbi:MAG: hypothetical protein NUW37_15365 [Planctomycetes bacterium]|nr:hypothetical protein [Planctomycetota bacterium]